MTGGILVLRQKYGIRAALIFVVLVVILIAAIPRAILLLVATRPLSVPKMERPLLIMHAGGSIDGFAYTNSLDALERNYAQGNRYFELDFSPFQHQNGYALVHDWDRFLRWHSIKAIPSSDEFRNMKIFGKYRSCDISCLSGFMQRHADAWVITDTKYDTKDFYSQYPRTIRDRTIFQAYNLQDIQHLKQMGVPNEQIALTTYKLSRAMKYLALFQLLLDDQLAGLFALTVEDGWLLGNPIYRYPERWLMNTQALVAAVATRQRHFCAHGSHIEEHDTRIQLSLDGVNCLYTDNF